MSRPRGEDVFKVTSLEKDRKWFVLSYWTNTVMGDGEDRRSAYYSINSKDKLIKAIEAVKNSDVSTFYGVRLETVLDDDLTDVKEAFESLGNFESKYLGNNEDDTIENIKKLEV